MWAAARPSPGIREACRHTGLGLALVCTGALPCLLWDSAQVRLHTL